MIIVLLGPTGSGKSDLALELAKRLDAAIVNADAFQVYKELSIATNKPDEQTLMATPHFLYDFVPLDSSYSVAEYQADARSVFSFLQESGKDIIVEGGTGLYVRAALFDYEFTGLPKIDESEYDCWDNEELYAELEKTDPESAKKIHPNNRRRIIRALAIAKSSPTIKSEWEEKQSHKPIYEARLYAVDMDRDELYRKIDERVERMFEAGLLEETIPLIQRYGREQSAFKAIGVHELFPYIDGERTIEAVKEDIKLDTRHYVRRQMTFIRHQFDVKWIKSVDEIIKDLK